MSNLERALASAKNTLAYRRVCEFSPYERSPRCRVHYAAIARPGDAFCTEVPYIEWLAFEALTRIVYALEKGTNNE